MLNQLTVLQAQEQLPELPQALKDQPVIITKDNLPVMIAFSIENFFSLLETADILADEDIMDSINAGKKQAEEGQYSDLADVKARLGL